MVKDSINEGNAESALGIKNHAMWEMADLHPRKAPRMSSDMSPNTPYCIGIGGVGGNMSEIAVSGNAIAVSVTVA